MVVIKKYRFLIIGIIILAIYFGIVFTVFSAVKPTEEGQWTLPALKEYVDQRFASMEIAVNTANDALNKRFDNTNEWRNTVENLGRTYMPRLEQENMDKAQYEIINNLRDELNKMQNLKQGGSIVWAYVLSGVSLLIGILAIKDKIIKK